MECIRDMEIRNGGLCFFTSNHSTNLICLIHNYVDSIKLTLPISMSSKPISDSGVSISAAAFPVVAERHEKLICDNGVILYSSLFLNQKNARTPFAA